MDTLQLGPLVTLAIRCLARQALLDGGGLHHADPRHLCGDGLLRRHRALAVALLHLALMPQQLRVLLCLPVQQLALAQAKCRLRTGRRRELPLGPGEGLRRGSLLVRSGELDADDRLLSHSQLLAGRTLRDDQGLLGRSQLIRGPALRPRERLLVLGCQLHAPLPRRLLCELGRDGALGRADLRDLAGENPFGLQLTDARPVRELPLLLVQRSLVRGLTRTRQDLTLRQRGLLECSVGEPGRHRRQLELMSTVALGGHELGALRRQGALLLACECQSLGELARRGGLALGLPRLALPLRPREQHCALARLGELALQLGHGELANAVAVALCQGGLELGLQPRTQLHLEVLAHEHRGLQLRRALRTAQDQGCGCLGHYFRSTRGV